MAENIPQDGSPTQAPPPDQTSRKVMIIGVDGATLNLILPWVQAGLLPNFARLMQEGSWGVLTSIIPPMTPTAWSSFLTGSNPGKHGLYDFVGRKQGTYETWLTNSTHRHGSSLWKLLGSAGKQVTVFNVPVTYPVEKVNGTFVSGLLTPAGASDGTWPPQVIDEIKRAVPSFTFATPGVFSPGEELSFLDSITALNRDTLATAKFLLAREPWDFYMAVFMAADILGHFMWGAMEKGWNPNFKPASEVEKKCAEALQNCYRQIDSAAGELMAAAGPDTQIIVMSDHGFGSLERYIHVNAWLRKKGYLKLKRTPVALLKRAMYKVGITPISVYEALRKLRQGERIRATSRNRSRMVQSLIKKAFLSFADVDWNRTRLYSFGFEGPIFVNLKGREPKGIVSPGPDYEGLLDRVIADLKAMRDPDTGMPLVGEVYRNRDLYWGPHAAEGPDLIFMPRDMKNSGFGLFEFASNQWLTRVADDRTGTHRMEGIVFLKGPGIRQGLQMEPSSIMDIAPTVLALMGQPIPAEIDGHVMEQAFTPELRQALNIRVASAAGQPAPTASGAGDVDETPGLDEEEEAIIRERLRDLGYVA